MKYISIFVISIILMLILLSIVFSRVFGKNNNEKIADIKLLHFSYSTGYHYNASIKFELECNDECILYYKVDGVSYEDKKEHKVDKELVKEIADKLNEYNVVKWDKYNKSNPNILDGNSFSLDIEYKDDKKISASGYESWPTNYGNVKKNLNSAFSKYIDEDN